MCKRYQSEDFFLTKTGSTSTLEACLGNLSSGSARNPAAILPDSVLFGAPPPLS